MTAAPAVSAPHGTAARTAVPRLLGTAALGAALLGGLAACSVLEGPTPQQPPRVEPAKPEVAPELVPGGTAADNKPYFTEVIRAYSAGTQPIEGRPIVDDLIAAGFDRAAMQVSADRSKTDLVADSIYVSVRWGDECLIGQFMTSDRSFTVDMPPAVGPDGSVCLIGSTRPIDW